MYHLEAAEACHHPGILQIPHLHKPRHWKRCLAATFANTICVAR